MAARDLLDAALDERPSRPGFDSEAVTEAPYDPETVTQDEAAVDREASVTD